MSVLSHISAPPGVAPGAGYTNVVSGSGRLVAISGQVALGADGTLVGPGDPEAQARQVFENLRSCLDAGGASFADVVKLAYFLVDIDHLQVIRKVRDEFVDTGAPPASTAVAVAALFRPEFLLEVEALALVSPAAPNQ